MTFSAFTTVAGNGKAGYSGDGGPASEGQFSEPVPGEFKHHAAACVWYSPRQ
jgi:hypothetical protein